MTGGQREFLTHWLFIGWRSFLCGDISLAWRWNVRVSYRNYCEILVRDRKRDTSILFMYRSELYVVYFKSSYLILIINPCNLCAK